MIKEIELKLFIGESIDHILKKAIELNWIKSGEEFQEDTYYTSIHKDFILSEECLRIRETNKICELTWKPPTTEAMLAQRQYWKQEIDLNIKGQKEITKALLHNLDFIEFVVVRKNRIKFDVDENTNIALDHIDTLGWFIEIETLLSNSQEGAQKNAKLADQLGLDKKNAINVPYRDLVKAGRVYRHDK